MSGGGGGGGIGPNQPEMITLEDLESFSDDQLSDSGNGSLEKEAETMEEDDERLLRYWQDVARGHQVEVSPGKSVQNWHVKTLKGSFSNSKLCVWNENKSIAV